MARTKRTRRNAWSFINAMLGLILTVGGALLVAADKNYDLGGNYSTAGGLMMVLGFVVVVVAACFNDQPRRGKSRYIDHH